MTQFLKRSSLIAAAMLMSSAALAQSTFPTKPVRLLVGFSAGGSIDAVSRLLAEELRTAWGQPVVVENRVGAAGALAAEMVAKAEPDGYNLLMTTSSHTALGAVKKQLPYDSHKSFTAINLVASAPNSLVTRADSPLRTLPAYIAAAKEKPGQVTYATSGTGGILHLTAEQFSHQAGVRLNHIPYKGANDVVLSVLAGNVQSSWSVVSAAMPLLAPDKLHIVAVASEKRSALVPNVPTFNEMGIKLVSEAWFGMLGPANLPPQIANRINDTIQKLLAKPEVQAKLAGIGAEPRGIGPAEFDKQIQSELSQFSEVVKIANIVAN